MKTQFRNLALLLSLAGCRMADPVSHVSGALTETTPVCSTYSQAQYDALDAELQGLPFFHNFNDADHKELIKHWHAIPKVYRDHMIAMSKNGNFKGFFKENISSSGLCSYGRQGVGCQVIKLSATQRNVIQFSFIHEVGHGMEFMAVKAMGQGQQAFDRKMQELLDEGRAHNGSGKATNGRNRIRSYSFNSINEFWADSFHNYYCSPESNDFIKKNLPKNFAFLEQVLQKPVWSLKEGETGNMPTPTPTPTPTPEGPGPKVSDHISSLLSLYNENSKTCFLAVGSVGAVSAEGDFTVKIKEKKKSVSGDAYDSEFSFKSNTSKQLARELSELRRNLPTYAANCPAE